ncbi:hypothetical protein ACIQOW_24225 [Kitasatospora sp. NPDC091335]|uniref:hypothetical protein n=1 Tax=Kitasatospora sp. NPDC091335 TaxID=3364085 RepID=UPI00381B0B0E
MAEEATDTCPYRLVAPDRRHARRRAGGECPAHPGTGRTGRLPLSPCRRTDSGVTGGSRARV